jgi:phenylpropionate dioxygenase-like ring-hydroxylating dioxygenase large terminal subunit
VGAIDDIPKDGDFFTCELLGRPLIVWNKDGEFHTYLNVCPHRHSTLSDSPCGHMDLLHCQYHGWEFDTAGDTRRIPDAKSFRPMQKGALGLNKYRTETAGHLIYVNLCPDGPSLAEALGPGYAVAQRLFAADRRLFLTVAYDVDANWKLKVENTLESYHIELIHPETFKNMPDERICEHELDPGYSTFSTTEPPPSKLVVYLNRLIHRIRGVPYSQRYKHLLYYPAIMMVETGLITIAESVFPTGPRKSKVLLKFFCNSGTPGTWKAYLVYRALRHFGRKFFTKVTMEDAGILPSIQRGMDSPRQPSTGLISIREERLYHFQEFIRRATCDDEQPVPAEALETAGRSY